jgi:hypothetical protein
MPPAAPVVERVVRVEPAALHVRYQIGNVREFRRLDKNPLLPSKSRDELDFRLVKIERWFHASRRCPYIQRSGLIRVSQS